jgi:phosphatidylinositol alpha-mannosyltransferase
VGVVYDDTIDRPGGIGLYVTTLGAALQRRGHHVEYLLGTSSAAQVGDAPVHSLARNVRVRFNGNQLSMPAWAGARRLERALQRGAFDVLHVQMPYSPVMAGRLITRADDRCVVVGTYHVASERRLPQAGAAALRLLKLRSAPRFDAVVSVSGVASAFARRWSRIDAGQVVPNMLDVAAVRSLAAAGAHVAPADVVFVGRLVTRKGCAHLLDGFARLRREPDLRLTRLAIVGEGPLRGRLERQARALGLRDRVTFHGALDDGRKLALLAGATVACFPSVFGESFGVVLLEALAAGAGVVLAGENAGYAELLADRRALVDPRDPDALAARLARLLRERELREAVARRQRGLLERFDVDVVTDQVLDVYRTALVRRRGRAHGARTPEVAYAVA